MNCRFAPAAVKERFRIRAPSWHGSAPFSSSRAFIAAASRVETRLHRAGVRAGADQGFVGALAQQELEGADDDRFARAGLAGDGGKPGSERPLEVLDQREIANAEGGEHCGHGGIMQRCRSFFKPMRASRKIRLDEMPGWRRLKWACR